LHAPGFAPEINVSAPQNKFFVSYLGRYPEIIMSSKIIPTMIL